MLCCSVRCGYCIWFTQLTFPCTGEQSDTLWILLHNDRKSRHRRIKKRRRYERLAATSQFKYKWCHISSFFCRRKTELGCCCQCKVNKYAVDGALSVRICVGLATPDRHTYIPMVTFLTPLASSFEYQQLHANGTKGSWGHAFTSNTCTESARQISYWPYPQR